jgi:hypothetical protein
MKPAPRRRGVVKLALEPVEPHHDIELPSSAAAETIAAMILESVGAVVTVCEARGFVLSWSDREALRSVLRAIVQLRQANEPEFEAWLRNYTSAGDPPQGNNFSAGPGGPHPRPESTDDPPGLVADSPHYGKEHDDREAV